MDDPATIDDWRARIDAIDERLVELLNQRAHCALEIGKLKRAQGMRIYQPEREAQVLAKVRECAVVGPFEADAIVRVFERIIDEARRLERLGDKRT